MPGVCVHKAAARGCRRYFDSVRRIRGPGNFQLLSRTETTLPVCKRW